MGKICLGTKQQSTSVSRQHTKPIYGHKWVKLKDKEQVGSLILVECECEIVCVCVRERARVPSLRAYSCKCRTCEFVCACTPLVTPPGLLTKFAPAGHCGTSSSYDQKSSNSHSWANSKRAIFDSLSLSLNESIRMTWLQMLDTICQNCDNFPNYCECLMWLISKRQKESNKERSTRCMQRLILTQLSKVCRHPRNGNYDWFLFVFECVRPAAIPNLATSWDSNNRLWGNVKKATFDFHILSDITIRRKDWIHISLDIQTSDTICHDCDNFTNSCAWIWLKGRKRCYQNIQQVVWYKTTHALGSGYW
jgi:hypothetical protein